MGSGWAWLADTPQPVRAKRAAATYSSRVRWVRSSGTTSMWLFGISISWSGPAPTSSMIATAILVSFHTTSLHLGAQVPQKMLCVYVGCDELDALTHDFRQYGFAISVNGGHLAQLNDAPPRVPYATRFSPSRLELSRPPAGQLTLQRPPLLIG